MILLPALIAALYTVVYYFLSLDWQSTALLGIGLAVGWLLYALDGLLFAKYYAEPGLPLKPVSRSLWMLLVFWPLAIFVATSTGSLLGFGLILGIGVSLTCDILRLQNSAENFKTYFQFPVASQLNQTEIQIGSLVWALAFLGLAASYLW